MWTFLATDAMGFGALFIAYAMLRVRAESWPDPRARLALALGLAFLGGELLEYRHLLAAAQPMRLGSDLFASTFYALTGYHGLHVLAGVVCLSAVLLGRAQQRTLEVVALYWHFVDLAWMPIFTFLYLLPTR